MCAEENKSKEFTDAVGYIKNSAIFSNQRYDWIAPLILKIVDGSGADDDIEKLIDEILSRKSETKKESAEPEESKDLKEPEDNRRIVKIKSIDNISNIGLLDVDQGKSIPLKDGLNIFYGKNGAGKSSFYLGLCKVFGKNKEVYSNINNACNDSCCHITCVDNEGREIQIKWDSKDEDLSEQNIMIFDGLISSFIIREDQINSFEMAHLKIEYFSLLYDLYDEIESRIDLEKNDLNQKISDLAGSLREKIPFIFQDGYSLNYNELVGLKFTEKEEQELQNIESQKAKIRYGDIQSVVKNLENARDEIEKNILSVFGDKKSREEQGKIIDEQVLKFDQEYFQRVNSKIEEYINLKKAFEGGNQSKISSLIPKDWLSNTKWEEFISSSIDFVNSLDKKTQEEYSENKCAYCHQDLNTDEAKSLIKAYRELHEEHKSKLDESLIYIDSVSQLFKKCLDVIDRIGEINKKLDSEFEHIGQKEKKLNVEVEKLKVLFQGYKKSIDNKEKIRVTDSELLASFWNVYLELVNQFQAHIDQLNKDIKNKEAKIKELEESAKPLKEKKGLIENRDNIINYSKYKKQLKNLEEKITDISSLRHTTSTLKTSFSQEAILKEFRKNLKEEYDALGFYPPSSWAIKPATRGGVNKRIYNIGDRKLSEIFSEGEQKLHALSDFLAQCESNKYKGIYIFDDPVNSLDEDNIEAVAGRILDLVNEGNQVIVFTHNLVFLNSIIDTQKEKITRFDKLADRIIIEPDINFGDKQKLKERMAQIDSSMDELSKISDQVIPEHKLRNVYDLISGYLEDYVEIIYFKNVINRFRPNIRMQSLDNLKGIDTNFVDEILKLFNKTSRRCARHSQPIGSKKPEYNELKSDVGDLKAKFKY